MEKIINTPPKIKRNQYKNCLLELLPDSALSRRPTADERERLEKEKGFEVQTIKYGDKFYIYRRR